ncbi:MAG: hypothetical protein IT423_02735, partial [Pirellulaceae bacterium]|nr:hypothetical protein [Pirellulaceae bacterium]
MPSSLPKLTSIRESWRAQSLDDLRIARQRLAIRLTFTAFTVILLATLIWLLFTPLFHPKTRFYFVTASTGQQIDATPIAFFQEDAIRFLSLDGSYYPSDAAEEFFLLDSPVNAKTALRRIAQSAQDPADVLIIHLAAHPIINQGRACLRCANFSTTNPTQGLLSLDEACALLSESMASTILLLLDTGREVAVDDVSHDESEFLSQLQSLLRKRSDDRLWVITACAPGEVSYRSLGRRGSVFLHAVSDGLNGLADLNEDRQIGLDEFYGYVASAATAMVAQDSSGAARQTPLLLRSEYGRSQQAARRLLASAPARTGLISSVYAMFGRGSASPASATAPVAADKATSPEDAAKTEAEKQQEKEQAEATKTSIATTFAKKTAEAKESAIEELTETINILPGFLANRVKRSIGLPEDASRVIDSDGAPTPADPATSDSSPDQKAATDNGTDKAADDPAGQSGDSTTGSSPANGGSAKVLASLPDLSRLGAPDQTLLQLIQTAWQFSDYLESNAVLRRPHELAPHAWLAWLTYLEMAEESYRTGAVLDEEKLRVELTAEIVAAYQFAMGEAVTTGHWLKNVSNQLPSFELPASSVPSIALAQWLEQRGGPVLSDKIKQHVQRLDLCLKSENREALDTLLKQSAESDAGYAELFYVRKLSQTPNLTWPLMQQTIAIRLALERALADPAIMNQFVNEECEQAYRHWLNAFRMGQDQIAPQWADKTAQLLDRSQQSLQRAQLHMTRLAEARRLRDQVLLNMNSILRWRAVGTARFRQEQLDRHVDTLLSGLVQISKDLDDPVGINPQDLYYQAHQLVVARAQIEGTWQQLADTVLSGQSAAETNPGWTVDGLLCTSLIRDQKRNRLLSLNLLNQTTEQPGSSHVDATSTAESSTWNAALAAQKRDRNSQIQAHLAQLIYWPQSVSLTNGTLPGQIQQLIKQFNRSLPSRYQSLQRADLLVRLLKADDASRFDARGLESELVQAGLLLTLQARSQLLSQSFPDALPEELPWLRSEQARVAQLASHVSDLLPAPAPMATLAEEFSSHVVSTGTRSLSLIADPTAEAEVLWRNVGSHLQSVWLLIDYDEEVIEVDNAGSAKFYRAALLPQSLEQLLETSEQEFIAAIEARGQNESTDQPAVIKQRLDQIKKHLQYPVRPMAAALASSTELLAGQELRVPIKVKRIGRGVEQTKIVWRLIGEEVYVRHETVVRLPAAEKLRLRIDGPPGSWTETPEGVVVHPWPNRPTEFRLGLSSAGGQSRNLSVDVLTLAERRDVVLPDGFVNDETSREIYGRLGAGLPFANLPTVSVEGDNQVRWLPLGGNDPSATQDPATAATKEPDAAAGNGPAGSESDKAKAQQTDIHNGLIVILTDLNTKQKMWRRVDTQVRHPRSYVEPIIGYDSVSQRATVLVKPIGGKLSEGQSVSVHGQILGGVPQGTEMQMDGLFSDSQGVKLYCQLPVTAPAELTFALDIDDFPRAFVFKVPCWRTQTNIPYQSGDQRIRIVQPEPG